MTIADMEHLGSNRRLCLPTAMLYWTWDGYVVAPCRTCIFVEKFQAVANRFGLQSFPVPIRQLFAGRGLAFLRSKLPRTLAVAMQYCPVTGKISSVGNAKSSRGSQSSSRDVQADSGYLSIGSELAGAPHGECGGGAGKRKGVRKSGEVAKKPACSSKFVKDVEPGFLRRAKVKSELTRRHYIDYSEQFRAFAAEKNLSIPLVGHSVKLDAALEMYCEHEALQGNGIFGARAAVYGEAWRRGLNLKLPEVLALSRAALIGWSNVSPGDSRDPLPWVCACDLAAWLFNQDCEVKTQAAKCLLVSFDTYVRPGVAVDLCTANVVLPVHGMKRDYDKTALLLAPSSEGAKLRRQAREMIRLLLVSILTESSWTSCFEIFTLVHLNVVAAGSSLTSL